VIVKKQTYSKINNSRKVANQELYEAVASKLNISEQRVKEIIKQHSNYIVQTIREGFFDSVTLPYLGKIKAKKAKIKMAVLRNTKKDK